MLETVAPEDAVRQRTRFPMLESIGPHPAAPEDAVAPKDAFSNAKEHWSPPGTKNEMFFFSSLFFFGVVYFSQGE